MNIGLLDIDYNGFPNLALMKISSYYKSIGHNVEFATMFNHYDKIFKSKIFSWSVDPEYCYNTDFVICGGTGYNLNELSDEIDYSTPDYSLYNCLHAYGYLTRGCPNKCKWCIVPEKEGSIREYMDIEQIISDKKSVILMDNNVLAIDHGIKQIEKIIKLKYKVDFNQGLDARLIDDSIAKLLSKVKWLSKLRMACDSQSMKIHIKKAVSLLRKYNCTPSNYFIYTLIKDIDESLDRIEFIRSLKCDPFAQPFRDFKNTEPSNEQKRLARWCNHKAIFKSVKFLEYK